MGLQLEHEILDHLASDWIESAHRLIEEYQFWIMEYRLCESDTLEHPLGVGIESLVSSSCESDFFEDFGFSLLQELTRHLVELPVEVKEFISREVLVEVGILWHESDPLLY